MIFWYKEFPLHLVNVSASVRMAVKQVSDATRRFAVTVLQSCVLKLRFTMIWNLFHLLKEAWSGFPGFDAVESFNSTWSGKVEVWMDCHRIVRAKTHHQWRSCSNFSLWSGRASSLGSLPFWLYEMRELAFLILQHFKASVFKGK